MLKVSELRMLCEEIEKRGDGDVYLQIRDKEGKILEQGYCNRLFWDDKQHTLYLSNAQKFQS